MKTFYRIAGALGLAVSFGAATQLANGQELLPTPQSEGVARDLARDGDGPALNGTPITDERASNRPGASQVPARPVPDNGGAEAPTARSERLDPATTGNRNAANPNAGNSGTAQPDNAWRYKFHQNRWWYWMPSNRWMVWVGNGWVDYDPSMQQTPASDVTIYAPARRTLNIPLPSARIYTGPRYYYDDFYRPYGGLDPYVDYPTPRYRSGVYVDPSYGLDYGPSYGPGYGSGIGYGSSYYGGGYYGNRGGITIGGRRVQIGIGF